MWLSRHRYSESRFFEVFCQTPKTGLILIFLLHMDVQPSTESYQLQEGGERGEATLWQGLCPWITLGSPSLSPSYRIYGWMTLTKCSNCTKFGRLILGKIIKIVATRYQSLRLKCTKFDFGSAKGSLQRLLRPPSWIWGTLLLRGGRGPTSKEREGGEGKGEGTGCTSGMPAGMTTSAFWESLGECDRCLTCHR